MAETGRQYFKDTYGDTAESVQSMLNAYYPDLGKYYKIECTFRIFVQLALTGYFSETLGYGYVYAYSDVLSHVETSFTMIAALIASDTPRQIDWHLRGAIRNGATTAEVKAIRQISIEVAKASGIHWKNEIPDIEDP